MLSGDAVDRQVSLLSRLYLSSDPCFASGSTASAVTSNRQWLLGASTGVFEAACRKAVLRHWHVYRSLPWPGRKRITLLCPQDCALQFRQKEPYIEDGPLPCAECNGEEQEDLDCICQGSLSIALCLEASDMERSSLTPYESHKFHFFPFSVQNSL